MFQTAKVLELADRHGLGPCAFMAWEFNSPPWHHFMLKYQKTNLKKNCQQFDVFLSKEQIKKHYEDAFTRLMNDLQVEGFRKGKAPRQIAEKEIQKETVYEALLKTVIPATYQELLRQENIKPIVSPKIELIKAKDDQDWQIRITIAEKPAINLKDYKQQISHLKAEEKKKDIWVPGKPSESEGKEADPAKKEKNQKELFNKIFAILLKHVAIEIPDLIIEEELNKKLTQLVDDVGKIGLTIENYLKSKNETVESMREKFKKEIKEMYQLEFILEEISDQEKITVEQKDLETLFANIKEQKAKEEARKNAYFYASLLKRQKTLDFLLSL